MNISTDNRCMYTTLRGGRCKFNSSGDKPYGDKSYCNAHLKNDNHILCICGNKINHILNRCWRCKSEDYDNIIPLKVDIVFDVLKHIYNFCNSKTMFKLQKLCSYTYDNLHPDIITGYTGKICTTYNSMYNSILKNVRLSYDNIESFVNLKELYNCQLSSEILDLLPDNIEVLMCGTDLNYDYTRFTSLKRLLLSDNNLDDEIQSIELLLPETLTHLHLNDEDNIFETHTIEITLPELPNLQELYTDYYVDVNKYSETLTSFLGVVENINMINKCNKLEKLGIEFPIDNIYNDIYFTSDDIFDNVKEISIYYSNDIIELINLDNVIRINIYDVHNTVDFTFINLLENIKYLSNTLCNENVDEQFINKERIIHLEVYSNECNVNKYIMIETLHLHTIKLNKEKYDSYHSIEDLLNLKEIKINGYLDIDNINMIRFSTLPSLERLYVRERYIDEQFLIDITNKHDIKLCKL